MKFVFLATAGALLANAGPATALTIVEVPEGEACKIASTGDFRCVWVAPDGSTSSAQARVSQTDQRNNVYRSVEFAYLPIAQSGLIEFELAYTEWGNQIPTTFTGNSIQGWIQSASGPVSGEVNFVSRLSSVNASPKHNIAQLDKAGRFLDSEIEEINGVLPPGGGLWTAALSWSFDRDDGAVRSFTAEHYAFAVPEPASWALMIAGFGLVGSASRRRRQALA